MTEPKDVLERLAVPGYPGVYSLGCMERRVTIYAQQVRSLNLAWALKAAGTGTDKMRAVVVGAGAAGLTAALALNRVGARVTILERNEVILPRFRANTQRHLHPHAYDWPRPGSTEPIAQLPLMNW